MQPFYKTIFETPSEYFYRMYLIRETFLRYKTNILCPSFNHAKKSVSSKNAVSLLNKTLSKNVKRKFSAK